MSKPLTKRCKMYCADYPCDRTKCDRGIIFKDGITKLVEKHIHDYIRDKEKYKEYRSSPLSTMNTI